MEIMEKKIEENFRKRKSGGERERQREEKKIIVENPI